MEIRCPECHKVLACESQWCGQKAQCPYCGNKFVITEIMLEPAASAGKSKWRFLRSAAAAVLCVAVGTGLGHLLFAPGGKSCATTIKPLLTDNQDVAVETTAPKTAESAVAEAEKIAPPDDAAQNSGNATAAATDDAAAADENNADASQASEQNSEDAADDTDDENYTYKYYDGEYIPYYRGYYYIGGVWVWRKHGRAPFPPPRVRPTLRSIKSPVEAAAVKSAPAKQTGKPAPAKPTASRPAATRRSTTKPAANRPGPFKSNIKSPTPVKRSQVRSMPQPGGGRVSVPRGPRR